MKEYTKVDDNTIQITDTTPKTVVSTYQYNDLVNHLQFLQDQKNKFNTDIDARIAEIQETINQADALQIKLAVAEDVVVK